MSDEGKKKWRTKRIIEHANPLFECWLGEWQQEAEKRGSNMKYNFQRARKSLSLYPLPLYTGQDCKLLAHFGNKICQMLDRRLAQHEEEFGPTDWTQVHKIKEIQKKRQRKKTVGPAIDAIPTSQSPLGNEESPRKKRSRTKNCYIPVLRSGAYALLMTLHQACFKSHYQGFMKKEELVAAAQPLCDVSLSKPDHVGSYYTGWSAMKTLTKKGLVLRQSHPPRTAPAGFIYVFLSNECAPSQCVGLNKVAAQSQVSPPSVTISKPARTKSLSQHTSGSEATDASSLKARTAQSQTENKKKVLPCISSVPASSASLCMPFTLLPGSFEVILCIDNAETSGKSAGVQPSNKDIILSELKRNGVKYSIRKLHVGDYLWVCQENQGTLSTDLGVSAKQETRELVLPVVVERKRMDDLAASIKDGRFREQKFRLRQCGLSHPVYLVEEHQGSVAAGHSLPEMTCLQAIVNTQIINEFTVKVVKGQRESAAYLTIMTRYLQSKYQNQCVRSAQLQDIDGSQTDISSVIETCLLPFTEFNTASMKNQQLTVKEMFAKHLLQLHGVSADKARAVVDKYETPNQLLAAYEEEGSIGAKKLLADLKWGKTSRNLGQVLSANIASLYTSNVLH
ncbi:crossover junction endonuclease MUS81-like isoform X6 [Portunus trituberculatus]|uniref:crossover junction endonuclease MUS81-like isoform X6 n=1 Tax=Portunus trituberculatus TaxID=210409 RepID=UPI001E1CC5F4|nr:crossover junction endonuclease MUS81-like isoform X6 [Portunus trituberculatus]